MMENLQPKLRFPEFKTEWKNSSFEEEFSIFNGYAFKSIDSTSEGARWIKIADVDINKISHDSPSFLPIDYIKKYDKFILKEGDYVVALTRPILNKKLKIARIDNLSNDSLLNQRVGKIISKNLNNFIFYYLQRDVIINLINDKIAGNDPPNLSPKEISNIIFNVPSLPEQTKIADFLGAVDKQLELLTTKKEKLQLYKKGVMQKLFSQEIRFTKEDGTNYPEWQEKTLGEVAKIFSGKSKKTEVNEGYNLYGSTGVIGLTEEPSYTGKSILVARVGANAGFLYKVDGNYGVTDNTLMITELKDNFDFIYYLLIKSNLNQFIFGSGQPLITGTILKKIICNIPSLEEQTKIADFLIAIDNQIDAIDNQITKTENYKKGLLQQMFV